MYICIYCIHPELKIGDYQFQSEKGARPLEREHQGSSTGTQGSSKAAAGKQQGSIGEAMQELNRRELEIPPSVSASATLGVLRYSLKLCLQVMSLAESRRQSSNDGRNIRRSYRSVGYPSFHSSLVPRIFLFLISLLFQLSRFDFR